MVVLEAAAITAGGIAAYKGGKAAITSTAKTVKTKMKLSGQEKERKEIHDSRKQERKERFSKVNEYRTSLKNLDGNRKEGVTLPSFNWQPEGAKKSARGAASSKSYSSRSSSTRSWAKK